MFGTIVGRILGALGFMAGMLYALLFWFLPESAGVSWVGATAAVGVAAWVYLDWDALARFFGSRGGREQLMSWVLVLVVTGICGLLLHVVQRHDKRWDLTEGDVHSLAERTVEVLRDVPDGVEVSVTGFYVSSFDQTEDRKRRDFKRLVDAAEATGSAVRFDVIDPELDPLEASRAEVNSNATVIITARPTAGGEDRTERLYSPDEQELANAVLRVTSGQRSKIVFVAGHGEREPTTAGERGLGQLTEHLRSLGFETDTWNAATEPDMPRGTDVLIIAGPELALDDREAGAIRQWVEDGGSLMLLAEPPLPGQAGGRTGLEGALLSWGLRLREDIVLDELGARITGDPSAPIADTFGFHETTQGFDLPVVFSVARSIEEANTLPEQVTVIGLAKTGSRAWGETDLDAEEVTFTEGEDVEGPLTLIAVAELHRDGEPGGRVLVAGDVDWVTDGLVVTRGNLDFAARTIGWLGQAEDVIQLPPREGSGGALELSMLQMVLTVFISVLAVPGTAGAVAVIVWIWRRGL